MDSKYKKIFDNLSPTTHKDERVLIIDGLNTFIRVFASIPSINDNGDHVGGVIGFLKSLAYEVRNFNATRCFVVFDGYGGSQRRRKIYPDYKGQRKNRKIHLNRHDEFSDLIDERKSMALQLKRVFAYLENLPVHVLSIDNVEADDVISYITYYLQQDSKVDDRKIRIVSTDRDFLQLASDTVEIISPVKKKLYTPELLTEEFNMHPDNYLLYRVITGDKSDNIPGVPGLGLKSLLKYFPILDKPATIDDLLEYSENIIANEKKPKKAYSKMVEFKDRLELNYKLMQLQSNDISGVIKSRIRDVVDNDELKFDRFSFMKLFNDDRLYDVIKKPEIWLTDSFQLLNMKYNSR